MAATDRLIDNALVHVPSSTKNALRLELWNVLDDFCRDTMAWGETVAVPLVADVASYLVAPAGTEVVQVSSVAHETLNVDAAVFELGYLILDPVPTVDDALTPLTAACILTPSLTAGADLENLVPLDLLTRWHNALLAGLISAMMAQPAKPYSNPQLAAYHRRRYLSDRAHARRWADTLGEVGLQMWRFPRFA